MPAEVNPNQVSVGEPLEPARRDFRQEVTDRIINMLENGVAPWQKPWNPADASLDMPMNPTTGKTYRGGNAIHLMATGLSRGYGDPRWMTYRQAAGLSWQVRKGEKGTQIEFWEVKGGRDTRSEPIRADDGDGHQPADERDQDRGNRLIHRVYTVFNAKQIEGIREWTPNDADGVRSGRGGRAHFDTTAARQSSTIRQIAPSTIGRRTAFTCPQSTRSRTPQATMALRCMRLRTPAAIRRG